MQFLEDQQGTGKPPLSPEERIELEMLRGEFNQLSVKMESSGKTSAEAKEEAIKKQSLIDPNIKSKMAALKNKDHSSSDSEVSKSNQKKDAVFDYTLNRAMRMLVLYPSQWAQTHSQKLEHQFQQRSSEGTTRKKNLLPKSLRSLKR